MRQEFQPTDEAKKSHGGRTGNTVLTREDLWLRIDNGVSPNYYGNPLLASNRSANIPDSENTSVWVTGLPAHLTYYTLMDVLRGRGKIYSSVISPPSGRNTGSAAKVTFFTHGPAAAAIDEINRGLLLPLLHHHHPHHNKNNNSSSSSVAAGRGRARARYNRAKTRGQASSDSRKISRVLHVRGPVAVVNPGNLDRFFGERFFYHLDRVVSHGVDAETGQVEYEYRFASWRCQAEFASMALKREQLPGVRKWYGKDPCASDEEEEGELLTAVAKSWR